VRKAIRPGIRLFTFGVGYDVNTALLDKIASDNGGVSDYVEPKEDLEVKVSNFFTKVNYPVLTDLNLNFGGVQTDLLYPRNMPDVFRGSQVTLIGRYSNPATLEKVRLQLSGKAASNMRTYTYDNLRFPLREDANDYLPRLWATRRVGWLMEQIRTNGEQKELRDEVVDLGTRYGIVTPYTSYLALEDRETTMNASPGVITRPAAQAGGGFGALNAPKARASADLLSAVTVTTGEEAVRQSKIARAQMETGVVRADDAKDSVRRSGSKTFYLQDGVWTDSEYKPEAKLPETALTFGSDAYFDLLKQKPKLAEYFSLGQQVLVVFEGRVFRVTQVSP
jgi:Ca-activated chloride channel family protein